MEQVVMGFAIGFGVFLCVITFALHVLLRLSFTRYDNDPSNIEETDLECQKEEKTEDHESKNIKVNNSKD